MNTDRPLEAAAFAARVFNGDLDRVTERLASLQSAALSRTLTMDEMDELGAIAETLRTGSARIEDLRVRVLCGARAPHLRRVV